MSDDAPPALDPKFLDDFFAEADEHLARIAELVVSLEGSVGKAQPDSGLVEEVFQQFHSFKGICGFAGLGPAEAVAHATEDYLRALRAGQTALTARGLELMAASARTLEQVVAAFRARDPLPNIDSTLADIKDLCSVAPAKNEANLLARPESADADLAAKLEEAKAKGQVVWEFRFAPSRELDVKGVNINSVRDELGALGEILRSTPHVQGKGKIVFEFLVAARDAPTDLAAWEAKGVSARAFQTGAPSAGERPNKGAHNPFLAPSHIVRVELPRLDELMRITGELVIQRSRLERQLAPLRSKIGREEWRGAQEASAALGRSLRDLREAIMQVRLVPVAEIFSRMPFVVRDLARQAGKKAQLKLSGQETSMDKHLIERLKDPLLHLVRNALSHGVETPEERRVAGKPEEATIELTAAMAGDSAVMGVRDDGRGIDREAVARKAREAGLTAPDKLDEGAILDILCASGFSTREEADVASGRGMGLAVVASAVRELGGTLALESEAGQWTLFTLRLPLTLAITEALIVGAAGQTCAVPQSVVREILQTSDAEIQRVNGVEAAPYRTGILPVIRLAELFHLKSATHGPLYMLVITSERGSVGLVAEKIFGQREVVVQTLRDPLLRVDGVSGATELGDGKPVLILDGAAITGRQVRPPDRPEKK